MVNRDKFTEQKIFIRRFKRRKKDPCIQILKEGERERHRERKRLERGERKLTWWVQTVFRFCPSGERRLKLKSE